MKTIRGKRKTLKGSLKYALDHCGVPDGKRFHALRWFGGWSYNVFGVTLAEGQDTPCEAPACPVCGEPMVYEIVSDFTARTPQIVSV